MQVSGASVIAQSCPGRENIILLLRIGQIRPPVGQRVEKLAIISTYRLNGGLLQHDFRQPDAIGIGAFSCRRAPGQHPAMHIVPGQQARCEIRLPAFCGGGHTVTMARTPKDSQPEPPLQRRGWVQPVGGDAQGAASAAFARAGFSDPTLVLRWREIAGPEVARLAQPMKLSGDILTLRATPGAALFLGMKNAPCASVSMPIWDARRWRS